MQTINPAKMRQDLTQIIRDVIEDHNIIRIANPQGSAILLPEEEYENLIESLELLSIPGFRESLKRSEDQVRSGETFSIKDALGD
jgi:antitoxin YefM